MDVSAHRKKAIDLGLIAVDLDNNKKYEEAVHKYTEASEIMIYVIKCIILCRRTKPISQDDTL
jgi:hypothetical protein